MSIEVQKTSRGQTRWRVRYREGGRNRAKSFTRRGDAVAFESEVQRRKRLGGLGLLDEGRRTVSELHEEWKKAHHPNLAPKTQQINDLVWRLHVEPKLGDIMLRDLTPREVEQWYGGLVSDGVGQASIEKAGLLLGQMMRRALNWGWVQSNPVALAHRPRKKPTARVRPPGLADVEAVRAQMDVLDRTFVSLVYLGGLRPGEVMGLQWNDITGTHVHVRRAVSLDEVRHGKTGERVVRLEASLRKDIDGWREVSTNPFFARHGTHVFMGHGGLHWGEVEYRAWRHRLKLACKSAGVERFTPYSLRHLRCSMLIKSGLSIIEVAEQMGHQASLTLDTYGHVLREFAGQPPIDIDDEVRRARRGFRSLKAVGQ